MCVFLFLGGVLNHPISFCLLSWWWWWVCLCRALSLSLSPILPLSFTLSNSFYQQNMGCVCPSFWEVLSPTLSLSVYYHDDDGYVCVELSLSLSLSPTLPLSSNVSISFYQQNMVCICLSFWEVLSLAVFDHTRTLSLSLSLSSSDSLTIICPLSFYFYLLWCVYLCHPLILSLLFFPFLLLFLKPINMNTAINSVAVSRFVHIFLYKQQ